MTTVFYQNLATLSLKIINGTTVSRVRPQEVFSIDSADSATIADLDTQGFDTGVETPLTAGDYAFSDPNKYHAHNPFGLVDPP